MSRRFGWLLVVAASLVGIFMITRASAVQGDAEDKTATDAATLLRRIAALEQRVATLEERPPAAIIPPALQNTKPNPEIPRNWGAGQINGQTFYFIPLSGGNTLPQQRAPSAPAK